MANGLSIVINSWLSYQTYKSYAIRFGRGDCSAKRFRAPLVEHCPIIAIQKFPYVELQSTDAPTLGGADGWATQECRGRGIMKLAQFGMHLQFGPLKIPIWICESDYT
jgi:hypothetical protein